MKSRATANLDPAAWLMAETELLTDGQISDGTWRTLIPPSPRWSADALHTLKELVGRSPAGSVTVLKTLLLELNPLERPDSRPPLRGLVRQALLLGSLAPTDCALKSVLPWNHRFEHSAPALAELLETLMTDSELVRTRSITAGSITARSITARSITAGSTGCLPSRFAVTLARTLTRDHIPLDRSGAEALTTALIRYSDHLSHQEMTLLAQACPAMLRRPQDRARLGRELGVDVPGQRHTTHLSHAIWTSRTFRRRLQSQAFFRALQFWR